MGIVHRSDDSPICILSELSRLGYLYGECRRSFPLFGHYLTSDLIVIPVLHSCLARPKACPIYPLKTWTISQELLILQ